MGICDRHPPPFLLSIESCSIFLTTLQDCLDAHFPARPLIFPLVFSFSHSLAHLPAHWLICPLIGSFARLLAHCPLVGSFAPLLALLPARLLICPRCVEAMLSSYRQNLVFSGTIYVPTRLANTRDHCQIEYLLSSNCNRQYPDGGSGGGGLFSFFCSYFHRYTSF